MLLKARQEHITGNRTSHPMTRPQERPSPEIPEKGENIFMGALVDNDRKVAIAIQWHDLDSNTPYEGTLHRDTGRSKGHRVLQRWFYLRLCRLRRLPLACGQRGRDRPKSRSATDGRPTHGGPRSGPPFSSRSTCPRPSPNSVLRDQSDRLQAPRQAAVRQPAAAQSASGGLDAFGGWPIER